MVFRRLIVRIGLALVASSWASLAMVGCSPQEEHLEPDPGVSPFYPGPAAPNSASSLPETGGAPGGPGSETGAGREAGTSAAANESTKIDARFGTNEVEHQLRLALRMSQKGDSAAAAELLDKVLAVEPINREALMGRASIALAQANAAPAIDDKAAAVDKAVALIRSLMRAYDTLKAPEVDFIKRALYAKVKVLTQQKQFDQALLALKEMNEMGFDPYIRVENDASMAALRSRPQYHAAVKADDDARLAIARQRTNSLPVPSPELPFQFTLPDLAGKKVSLSSFKGKVVIVDLWGTWCGPCREAIPTLVSLYTRWHAHGLEVIGLSYEKEASTDAQAQEMVKSFVTQTGIPYTCLIGDAETLKQIPGMQGFPTTLVLDRQGRVRVLVTENHANTMDFIADVVRVLLNEKPDKPGAPKPGGAAKGPAAKPNTAAQNPAPKTDAATKETAAKPDAAAPKPDAATAKPKP